jgi:hemerythrin-like domain-containing protein
MDARSRALAVIRNEHRSLAAVIETLLGFSRDMRDQSAADHDFPLLWSLVYYIDAVPEELHHPKEEQVLFMAIRRRTRDIDGVLDDLARQHSQTRRLLDRLSTLLGRVEARAPGAEYGFAEGVARYADFHAKHMALEEDVVIPCAERSLTPGDWDDVAAAFSANRDPLGEHVATANERFRMLYDEIVARAPRRPGGAGPSG